LNRHRHVRHYNLLSMCPFDWLAKANGRLFFVA